MSLRKRLSLVAAMAVGVAVVLVAVVCYWIVRTQLSDQVDSALRAQANAILSGANLEALNQRVPGISANAGGPAPYVQIVTINGSGHPQSGSIPLPVDGRTVAVAQRAAPSYIGDIQAGENRLRQIVFPADLLNGEPVAIQLARPLGGIDHLLARLRVFLVLLCAAGAAFAAALGRVAARRVLAPLAEVTQAAQHISETDDLSRRIVVHEHDEVGALATRFNAMLDRLEGSRAALDESVRAQRQLVADASHELRTPVTSLRTNIEVLLAGAELSDEERHRLLADVVEQSEELSALVGDLIDLARGDLVDGSVEDARLDGIAEEAVARAQRNFPHIHFQATLAPVLVEGMPERLGRALNNLLDNAARHSPPGGVVEVTVSHEGIRVRDHGTGVEAADLPHVFDRFYRGVNARGRQGSGLGLAIVRQVAEQHGGTAYVANAPEGGAVFTLRLPVVAVEAGAEPGSVEPALRALD